MDAGDEWVNTQQWDALLRGDYHVGLGAIAVAGIGAGLVLGLVGGDALMVVGLVLVIVGTGILVDTWAHGFAH